MVKGFHNARFYLKNGKQVKKLGQKRCKIYGSSELKALQLFNGFFEKHKVVHEQALKGKTSKGSKTIPFRFSADFYFPLLKLDLETNPAWHKHYEKVVIRDQKRLKLLKEKLGVETMVLEDSDLNPARIAEICQQIESLDISPEVLDYYI